jgi:hypothetical protein
MKTKEEIIAILSEKYKGNSNYGKPKSDYANKLANMSNEELSKACRDDIWLSAYANNNPRSDYHWMCDMCYDICKLRETPEIYNTEHAQLVREAQ